MSQDSRKFRFILLRASLVLLALVFIFNLAKLQLFDPYYINKASATTPLLFINLVALTCLVPIKGTKKELARLKERETYIKLRLEYDSVMEV